MKIWNLGYQKLLKVGKKGAPNVIKGTENMVLLPGSDEDGHDHDHEHGEEGHHHELDPHTCFASSCHPRSHKHQRTISQTLP